MSAAEPITPMPDEMKMMDTSRTSDESMPALEPMSQLEDRLARSFSGDALMQLEQMGVSAFDSSEVERRVLAEAFAAEEKKEAEQDARREAAIAAAAAAATASTPAPRRIPKKSTPQMLIPTPRARERDIVHPAERAPPSASKKFRFTGDATGVKHGGIGGKLSQQIGARPQGESIMDRVNSSRAERGMEDDEDDEISWRERQRRIESGEMTPFAAMGGKEKTFTRAEPKRILPPPITPTSSSRAAAAASAVSATSKGVVRPLPSSSPSSSPTPKSSLSSTSTPRTSAGGGTPLPTPFPRVLKEPPGPAPKMRAIPRKASATPTKAKQAKPIATPIQAKSKATKSTRKRKARSEDEASSDSPSGSESDAVSDTMSDTPRRRVKVESRTTSPWTCEACTFINPSDFTNRCEMCHTVRSTPPTSETVQVKKEKKVKVKSEPSSSPPPKRTKVKQEGETKSPPKKRAVKKENEDADSDDLYEDEGEEEDDDSDSVDDDEVDSDDPLDAVFQRDDDVYDAEDGDEVVSDEEVLENFSRRGRKANRFLHDDYEDYRYEDRIQAWRDHQQMEEQTRASLTESSGAPPSEENLDVVFEGDFIIPAYIWNKLFAYQKTCCKWLWELHAQQVGGIIADEMGLGKTIQLISFLAGLHYSAQHSQLDLPITSSAHKFRAIGPTLIVVPATILSQWIREFHEWYPDLRIYALHDSVPHEPDVTRAHIVHKLFKTGGVLLTTYQSVRTCKHLLLQREWGYVVLDEGHKIKSPDASITLLLKQLLSIHRIILTGSPIQNSLVELWSLFDFVFPGKLGTLPIFEDEFVGPIIQGGYTSATPVQIQLAYKCALILRDLINPYILRRSKSDVAQHLPPKTEQVLFCDLTPKQHQIYRQFLDAHAKDIAEIVEGKMSLFRVIHYLRKICNHADLLELKVKGNGKKNPTPRYDAAPPLYSGTPVADYGSPERSGKLKVVEQVLRMWKEQGHRCLIFSQTQQMLDIIETFVQKEGYQYRRIDGSTSIKSRLPLIDEFNHNPNIFIMLLTTRAGGLGVNLTGANRVILYDPDWNPACDAQARERAYRIGQSRSVTVYRLITRGCIEEKVYHRQIWKQFLTDKVLRDPKQKRFFSNHDIKDLFSLAPLHTRNKAHGNETAKIFKATGSLIQQEDVIQQERDRQQRDQMQKQEPKVETKPETTNHALSYELEDGEVPSQPPVSIKTESAPPSSSLATAPALSSAPAPPSSTSFQLDVADYDPGVDNDEPEQSSSDDNNRILAALFSRSGIQSAMDHDAILGASSQQEKAVLDQVVSKFASRAIEKLKQSCKSMRNAPVNAPTWTGRNGAAGAPKQETKRFGNVSRKPLTVPAASASTIPQRRTTDSPAVDPSITDSAALSSSTSNSHFDSSVSGFSGPVGTASSASLLARMKARSAIHSGMASHTGIDDATIEYTPSSAIIDPSINSTRPSSFALTSDGSLSLAAAIRASLTSHDDGLTSNELLAEFASQIGPLDSDKLLFRQLLRSIAVLRGKNKAIGEPGRWKLKQEFE